MTIELSGPVRIPGNSEWPIFDPSDDFTSPTLFALTLAVRKSRSSRTLRDLALEGGAYAAQLIETSSLASYHPLLLVAHGPWQPDNRIVRHNRLWRSRLSSLGVDQAIPIYKSPEVQFHSDQGVRFAGLVELRSRDLSVGIEACRSDGACALLMAAERPSDWESEVRRLFQAAFPSAKGEANATVVDWRNLVADVYPRGTLVARVVGAFDDAYLTIDFFGEEDLIVELTRAEILP